MKTNEGICADNRRKKKLERDGQIQCGLS